jgi:hypothetical protein
LRWSITVEYTDHPLATKILYGLIQLVSEQPQIGTAIIDIDIENIAISKIWAASKELSLAWKILWLEPPRFKALPTIGNGNSCGSSIN